jgi:hypothetical protein
MRPAAVRVPFSLVLAGILALGCATAGVRPAPRFELRSQAGLGGDDDPWYPKVAEWQTRMRAEGTRLPAAKHSLSTAEFNGMLLDEMSAYRDEQRVELARRIDDWAQRVARRHYVWDPSRDPRYDHWPTVGELLANNGDDCDGLDLIAFQLLREFGFPPEQVFRAILRRDKDRANHMVTFWFEDPNDPWVLDATGAATLSMRHFSELPGWTPTKVFNEWTQYTVRDLSTGEPVATGPGAARPRSLAVRK